MDSKSLPLEKIRELEKKAISIGLSERILVENVSSHLCETIVSLKLGKKVLVVAGKGNNGADVLSCARKLFSRGYDVKIVLLSEQIGEEGNYQKNILETINIPIYFYDPENKDNFRSLINDRDFVLDGIFGIGIKGEVASSLKSVIELINNSGKKVVSCDIPSGLSPDEGIVLGAAISADYTITFIAPKKGFFTEEGKILCGKVIVSDIGISRGILEDML